MEKTCIFYAGKYHLSMILLKMLSKENVKKYTVITFLENSLEYEIESLKTKYNIEINSKNNVDFTKTNKIDDKKTKIIDNMIIIIEGDHKYVKEVNEYLLKITDNEKKNIRVINCYDYNLIEKLTKEKNKKQ